MIKKKTSQEQLKLKRQAKAAEAQARQEAEKSVRKPVPVKTADQSAISFDQWWMSVAKNPKIRPHLKEIFWADFKSRGYSKKETSQKYYELLDNFGFKL